MKIKGVTQALPHSIEAERTLLGAILIDNGQLDLVADIVQSEHFHRVSHGKIYSCLSDLIGAGGEADLVTVTEELKRRQELDLMGGVSTVAELVDGVPRSDHAVHYAGIIREKAALRDLIKTGERIIERAFEEKHTASEQVEAAERQLLGARPVGTDGLEGLKTLTKAAVAHLDELASSENRVAGLCTGFPQVDSLTGGLQPGDLTILAGRPSMGKTAFALDVSRNVAKDGKPVAYFSLEMTKVQLVLRLLASEGRVNGHRFKDGKLSDDEWTRAIVALGVLEDVPLFLDDAPHQTVKRIRAEVLRLKRSLGLSLVVVDYLQLVTGAALDRHANREQLISSVSRELKALAKEADVPVLALAQLSREPEKRKDHRPLLADLRESGAIEQDADLVAFIYRAESYGETEENKGQAEFIISKHRSGPTGMVELVFVKDYPSFFSFTFGGEASF